MDTAIFAVALNLRRSGITISDRIPVASVTRIILGSNKIPSLFGFPPTSSLTHLGLDQTAVTTLYDFPKAPNLSPISFQGTPLTHHPQNRIVVLLVTTGNLPFIQCEVVPGSERRLAQQFRSECQALARGG
jgi:hypothetical protein